MKQKLYALDAFFIEKLKLSENYPYTCGMLILYWSILIQQRKYANMIVIDAVSLWHDTVPRQI